MDKKQQFTLWYFLGVIVLFFAAQTFLARQQHVGTLSYSDFKTLLQAGKVTDVVVGSETIVGTIDLTGAESLLPPAVYQALKVQEAAQPESTTPEGTKGVGRQAQGPRAEPAPHRVVAQRVEDPQLTAQLDAAKIRYTAAKEDRWLSTLFSWVLPAVIFVLVWNVLMRKGMGSHMGSMMEIGQSKAKVYVQSQTGVRFADVAGIDEAKEELMEVVEFLRNPDRYRRLGGRIPKGVLIVGVIIMAATNRPEILDPALLRPGRFDRHVAIDRPDLKGREQILKVHVRNVTLAPKVDLSVVAAKTAGFAGADLANIVNEAALRAARKDKPAVEMRDFEDAIDRVIGGLEKRNRVMNPAEKETVAYHEAGHALIAESRRHADRVSKVSIIPRGIGALGFTQQLPTEDRYLLKRSELLDRLDVLLGGRVAEELVYGDISTGAQNDLQRATDMARHMITQYGMSERLGHVTFDAPHQGAFLNVPEITPRAAYSEQTAQWIDEEIAKLVSEAHARVLRTLTEKRATLDALSGLLLRQEVVERAELDALLKGRTDVTSPEALPAQTPLAAASAVGDPAAEPRARGYV